MSGTVAGVQGKRFWRRRTVRYAAPLGTVLAALLGFMAGEGSTAIGRALRDPLSIIDGRSPGARPDGALFQTKPAYATAPTARHRSPGVPEQRVLSAVRSRPAAFPTGALPFAEEGPEGFGPDLGPLGPAGEGPIGPGPQIGDIPSEYPGGPFLQGGSIPGNDTTPDSAVPEPSTWFFLMVGIAAIGLNARRRRAATRANESARTPDNGSASADG